MISTDILSSWTSTRLAAEHFERLGLRVLARNHHTRFGELDLVLAGDGVLVFCEVKTRSGTGYGSPLEAVTAAKQARLKHLAGRWLDAHDEHASRLRFDVVGVRALGIIGLMTLLIGIVIG